MSRLIHLSQGQSAVVDDADFDWLSRRKWTAQKTDYGFYAMRRDKGRLVLMHRLICNTPDGLVTDHIDGNRLNNQRHNLRIATQQQNLMNRRGKRGGTSTYKGVWLDRNQSGLKRWRAGIRLNGKIKYLGRFYSEADAGLAYEKAETEYFGEFAYSHRGTKP